MLGHLLLSLSLPLFIGLVFSLAFEALLSPRPAPLWQRPMAANVIHLGSWLLLFGLFTLLLQRPWFAVVFVLSLQLVVVQSSNTKSKTLNEPFICHDFEYFWDAILHPRLYVPFLALASPSRPAARGPSPLAAFSMWSRRWLASGAPCSFYKATDCSPGSGRCW